MEIHNGRWGATLEDDFVIFLIGARINKFSKLLTFLPVAKAMGRMQRELLSDPSHGCLHIDNWFGRNVISVQYWRSFEALETYSRRPDAEHLPAWADFNKRVRDSGDIGIWHETYLVKAGQYEAIYGNMPKFGLGLAGHHAKLTKSSTAALRTKQRQSDEAPVEAY